MCHKTNNGKLVLQYLHSRIYKLQHSQINAAAVVMARNMNDLSVLRSGARALQKPLMDMKVVKQILRQVQIHKSRIIWCESTACSFLDMKHLINKAKKGF